MNDHEGVWVRVSKQQPCGICEKHDWCTIGEKGYCCMRCESPKPIKNGGWFWPFDTTERPTPVIRRPPVHLLDKPTPDFAKLRSDMLAALPIGKLEAIAVHLGVSEQSLGWLGTLWTVDRDTIAFPMYDATCPTGERPCGIRLRTMDGKKFAVTGSKSGVFFPYGALLALSCARLFICEGPTDTAACLDMGVFAIGRASCQGGEDIVLSIIRQLGVAECIVVSDNDGPGTEGASKLLAAIKIPKTRLVPPSKDLRAFVRDGGNRELLESLIKNRLRK